MGYSVLIRLHYGCGPVVDYWAHISYGEIYQTLLKELLKKCLIKKWSIVSSHRGCKFVEIDPQDVIETDFSSETNDECTLDLYVDHKDLTLVDSIVSFTSSFTSP